MADNDDHQMMGSYPSPQLTSALQKHNANRSKAGMQTDSFDVSAARSALGDTGMPLPAGIDVQHKDIAGVSCITVTPNEVKHNALIVYLHGGGYCAGSWQSHKGHASWMAHYSGREVIFPEYRRAPEARFPAAFDDGFAVVSSLFETTLDKSDDLLLAGDSAGAGMCVAITRRLLDEKRGTPKALALLCGMYDLNPATSDYLINYGRAREMASLYVGDADPTNPRISPVFADLDGFPPMLVQLGGDDYIKDDSIRLANKAIVAGAPVVLEHWPKMPHVWQRYVPEVPEANQAIKRAAEFLAAYARD